MIRESLRRYGLRVTLGLVSFLSLQARAGLLFSFDGMYEFSNLKLTTSAGRTNMFVGGVVGATAFKDPSILIGARFNYVTDTVTASDSAVKVSASGLEQGPHLALVLGKTQAWQISFSYLFFSKMSLSENGTDLGTGSGTGYQGGIVFAPEIAPGTHLGGSFAYRTVSVTKLATPAGASTVVAYTASSIVPTIVFAMSFGGR